MNDKKTPAISVLLMAAVGLTCLMTLLCALIVFQATEYLFWVATKGDAVDVWTVLTLLELVCAIGGVGGAWLLIKHRKPGRALLLLPLALAGSIVVGANRCDVLPSCAWSEWATLPTAAYEWKLPLRKRSREADLGRRGPDRSRVHHDLKALDGDTLLFDGKVVRLAGVDAPELGQKAHCWAEAALGGESRNALERALQERPYWELAGASPPDADGRTRANLVTKDGGDLADHMAVYGFAARTEGRWNWCGPDRDLHSPREDEAPPHGPNIWWPSDELYDARSAD